MENKLVRITPHTLPMTLDKPLLVYVNDENGDRALTDEIIKFCANGDCVMVYSDGEKGHTWSFAYRHPREDQSRYDAIERKQTRRMCVGELAGKLCSLDKIHWSLHSPLRVTEEELAKPTVYNYIADTYADIVAGNIRSTEVEI